MKTKKGAILLVVASLLLVVTGLFNGVHVTADSNLGYTTTITTYDGHNIDVGTITPAEVVSEEDYIKQHLNTDLVQDTGKFELADMLLSKSIIADETYFAEGEEQNIDVLNNEHMDAVITMTDIPVLVYDLDENSNYYVAKANTLQNDPTYRVSFADFAYTNVNGELIYDAIYDYETGLAYIPKFYKEEDKNGRGFYNVQIELVQMVNTQFPTTEVEVKMNVDGMPGEYATTGIATVDGLGVDFGLQIALDDTAKNNLYAENIRVKVNGVYDEEWYYFSNSGILQLLMSPNNINSLEIEINPDNADRYYEDLANSAEFLEDPSSISANTSNMKVKTEAKTWIFDHDPQPNDTYTLVCSTAGSLNSDFVDIYYDTDGRSGNADVYIDKPHSGTNWNNLAGRIKNNDYTTFNLSGLNMSNGMIQHQVKFNRDFTQHGVTIPAGAELNLRCSHGGVTVSAGQTNAYVNGHQVRISWGMFVRVLEVQDDYLIVGITTNALWTQNGVAICKIAYQSEGGGTITIHKVDRETYEVKHGDSTREGAVYGVYDSTGAEVAVLRTDANGRATTDKLRSGNYTVREKTPPTGYLTDTTTYNVTISKDNKEPTIDVYDDVIKGNVRIVKKLGETEIDAKKTLSGAQFKLTQNSDNSKVYYTNTSSEDGVCYVGNLPFGVYTVEECNVPNSAYKVNNWEVNVTEHNKTYEYNDVVDSPKEMQIAVHKSTKVNEGEATDAVVQGAIFTVYKDAAATQPYLDKDGNVVTIGPTDENGYAISKKMWTGYYYLKETTFPEGIDPDATVEGETVTYREKVYPAEVDNASQGNEPVVKDVNVINVPKRNHIEIYKHVGETSNTDQFPLDQCEFTATLKSTIGTDHVFSRKCTAETTRDTGYCIIEELPYGEYVVEETKVSPITLKCDNFTVFVKEDKKLRVPYAPKDGVFETTILDQNPQTQWLDEYGNLVDIPKVMQIKIRKIDANWEDGDPVDYMQGDATLEGARYAIYRYDPETDDYTEDVYTITVDHRDDDGYWCAESDELLVGKYMVKELISYSEDGFDYSYAEGYLVDPNEYYFEVKPDTQTERISYHVDISKEEVIRGAVYVVKFDEERSNLDIENDSDKVPSAGAILRLTLDSNPDIYYTVKLDDKGYGEFLETNDAEGIHTSTAAHDSYKYYPYTIPYGKYTITEDKEADETEKTSFYVQPVDVTLHSQTEAQYRIESDNPVPVWPEIIKTDKTNGRVVNLAGAEFKVWDVDKNRFVEMAVYPSDEMISTFKTRSDGKLMLPEKIYAGDYVIYEVKAPKGYYLEDDLRLPENEADYGKVGGKRITIDKVATGLKEDAINPGEIQIGELVYSVEMPDTPLYVNLLVEKKGEKFTDTTTGKVSYVDGMDDIVTLDQTIPTYEMVGLANVTFELYANEEIVDANGVTQVHKDEKVDTFVTNDEGIGQSRKDLYPGEYRLHEASVPEGYTYADDQIILLENENQLVKSQTTRKVVQDERQTLGFEFKKIFEEYKFITGNEEKRAVFGVYVRENIKNYAGNNTLFANDLVDLMEINGDGEVALAADLPEGKYYIKELFATFPYSVSDKEVDFELKYSGNTKTVVYYGEDFINTTEGSTVLFIKVSQSSDDDLIMEGNKIETSASFDEKISKTLDMFKEMSVEDLESMQEAIKAFYEENDIIVVPQATYEIWLKEDGSKKLCEKNAAGQIVPARFTTDGSGAFAIAGIPKGRYFLKEVEAPADYEISEEPVEFIISDGEVGATIYQAIPETLTIPELLHKTDIYTGENVPNCTFEIQDKDGNVLLHSITDEKGVAWIPQDMFKNGEKYYYVELDAPDVYKDDGKLYVLNTEPHEFIAEIDDEGKWVTEKLEVENLRPLTEVELIKTDDEGNRVPNCKFELKSKEEGLFYEVGVTDENGIYVFKDVPKGEYIYTELEAPEEYEIDTTPHEIFVEGDKMVIEFVNTGDIPVIILSVVAVVCAAGIVFLVVKKVKSSKKD